MGPLPRMSQIPPQPEPQQAPLPVLGFTPSVGFPVWQRVSRYVFNAPGASTSAGGDIALPPQYTHAMIIWRASDTSANNAANFGLMQVAKVGGAIDTGANYAWTDWRVDSAGGTVVGAVPPGGTNFGAFVTTGGGTGPQWSSRGAIYLDFYSAADLELAIRWHLVQINGGVVVHRTGAGYHSGTVGPTTKVRFSAGVSLLAAGTTFDLFVSA